MSYFGGSYFGFFIYERCVMAADMENKKQVTEQGSKRGFISAIRDGLGFYKNSPYVREHMRDANARSAIYMALVIVLVELYMIIRYIKKYVIEDPKCDSIGEFFEYTYRYWILLAVAVSMIVYARLLLNGRVKKLRFLSDVCVLAFAGFCLYFGIITSISDFSRGRMIICFLMMTIYVACLLIWRPYLSVVLLTGIAILFNYLINTQAVDKEGNHLSMTEGDMTNYITFFISVSMVAISIYHQRHREAIKSESLKLMTITDELTGLPNTHRFDELAKEYMDRYDPEKHDPVYAFFNIDSFRTYNDRYGYEGGNQLLKFVAGLIKENFNGEPFCRTSDDHFSVLTQASGFENKLIAMNEKLKEKYANESYLAIKAGIYRPKDKTADPKLEINHARFACGLLKNQGDKLFIEYDDEKAKGYELRQYVLNNIDRAVKEGYIKVLFQPVVWAEDGELCGCEALARWIDPEVGFLSPGVFVPVLEECRQIHKLDRCIYETVCRTLREAMDAGKPAFPVSLNFSRLDFELMDVVGELEGLVEKYKIPRDYLHVEITESAISDDTDLLKKAMDTLHKKGYTIWLDDFGSGYSSMNVLKDYDFDLLKIDMVFLKNFEGNQNSRKIIKSILDMAKALNMKTLTEGVETKEAVDFLHDAGCGRLQGYFYGKPMTYDEVLAGLEEGKYKLSENLV